MPVRIHEIAKKLGLENKDVMAKAKALGIVAAKVPTSSLDKISAEYLEEELMKDRGFRPPRNAVSMGLANFKAFAGIQNIPIKPITLIFGANSAGKSSIIHGALLAHVSPSGSKPAKGERFKTSHPEVSNSYHLCWYKQGVSIAS